MDPNSKAQQQTGIGMDLERVVSAAPLWVWLLLLVLVSFGIYANSLTGAFLSADLLRWQDTSWVDDTDFTTQLGRLFVPGEEQYRPIPYLVNLLDYYLWGANSTGFHITNVVFNCTAVLLVFFVVGRLLTNRLTALLAALLFATHPVHTEAVAYIAGRTDVIMAIFVLGSLIFYMRFREPGGATSYRHYGAAIVCFLLALMSKEAAISVPLIWLAYEVYFRPRQQNERWISRFIYPLAPAMIMGSAYLVVKGMAGAASSLMSNHVGWGVQFLTMTRTYSEHVWKLLLPYDLNHALMFDFNWSRSLNNPPTAGPMLLAILLLAAVVWLWRRSRVLSFGVAWVLLSLLPISNLLAIEAGPILAERYLYLPSFGFCLILAVVLTSPFVDGPLSLKGLRWRVAAAIGMVAIIGIYSILTIDRNRDWDSQVALLRSVIEQHPDATQTFLAHRKMGTTYVGRGMWQEAVEEFTAALVLNPTSSEIHSDLGSVYQRTGEHDKAEHEFEQAVALDSTFALGYLNLGTCYFRKQQLDTAVAVLSTALELDSTLLLAHQILSALYSNRGDTAKARYHLQAATALRNKGGGR